MHQTRRVDSVVHDSWLRAWFVPMTACAAGRLARGWVQGGRRLLDLSRRRLLDPSCGAGQAQTGAAVEKAQRSGLLVVFILPGLVRPMEASNVASSKTEKIAHDLTGLTP